MPALHACDIHAYIHIYTHGLQVYSTHTYMHKYMNTLHACGTYA